MVNVDLKSLIEKLNDPCRRTLEGAAALCLSRTNYNVEVEHWLTKLLEPTDSDLMAVLRHFEVDITKLGTDLNKMLDQLKTGNARPPALSPHTVDLARNAWMIASVNFGAPVARSGHLLCALLADESLARIAKSASSEFEKISADNLMRSLNQITADTSESAQAAPSASGAPGDAPQRPTGSDALSQFTIDLTGRAKAGEIDPVLCRESEIRQVIDILTRRRQNNPILTGEAGVGKTAVAEGFALRIVAGDVPPALKDVELRTLDLGLLQAGAGIKGEFENRLKSVIDEVKASPRPIILFIDEAHTLIGAGGSAGQGDAANLLKPALARGELRTIAATTWAEYKKYFEKDAALARRFQVVKVDEPNEQSAIEMMRGLSGSLESHHQVRVLDEAIVESVRLSQRYLSGRQLPDKSVSLLDTACARVAIGNSATPPAIDDARWRIRHLSSEIDVLQREAVTGSDHLERIELLKEEKAATEDELAALEERWQKEAELVAEIREIRQKLEGSAGDDVPAENASETDDASASEASVSPLSPEVVASLQSDLQAKTDELTEVQGEHPLMQVCVDGQAVAEVVSSWSGIPVGRMVSDEIKTILQLKQRMQERIVGQDHALEAITQSIRTSRAGMTDPRRPIGVFMLVGTSGTGKTETAVTLAELLYGGEQNMTVINMSEFKEEHKVSLLTGSPPGYVGYGEGGVLTEAVRRRPYSVVLLDEMEKAHPGVQDIFYQVFDKGMLRDGEGRDIDFRNTVILMTSNACTDLIMSMCEDIETRPEPADLAKSLHENLQSEDWFKPAFLGRLTLVPYFPLTDDVLQKITKLQLGRIGQRIKDTYRASFDYSDDLVASVASRCTEVDTGARNIDHILSRSMLPEMSAEFLARMADGKSVNRVRVSLSDEGEFQYEID